MLEGPICKEPVKFVDYLSVSRPDVLCPQSRRADSSWEVHRNHKRVNSLVNVADPTTHFDHQKSRATKAKSCETLEKASYKKKVNFFTKLPQLLLWKKKKPNSGCYRVADITPSYKRASELGREASSTVIQNQPSISSVSHLVPPPPLFSHGASAFRPYRNSAKSKRRPLAVASENSPEERSSGYASLSMGSSPQRRPNGEISAINPNYTMINKSSISTALQPINSAAYPATNPKFRGRKYSYGSSLSPNSPSLKSRTVFDFSFPAVSKLASEGVTENSSCSRTVIASNYTILSAPIVSKRSHHTSYYQNLDRAPPTPPSRGHKSQPKNALDFFFDTLGGSNIPHEFDEDASSSVGSIPSRTERPCGTFNESDLERIGRFHGIPNESNKHTRINQWLRECRLANEPKVCYF